MPFISRTVSADLLEWGLGRGDLRGKGPAIFDALGDVLVSE
jgi:hypothetical protein